MSRQNVVDGNDCRMGLIFLSRIDGVAHVRNILVAGVRSEKGNESGYITAAVVANAQQGQAMGAAVKGPFPVELVLLAMLQAIEKSVPI